MFSRAVVVVWAALALLAGLGIGGLTGTLYGRHTGAEEQLGRAARSQVEDLTALIDSQKGLVKAANDAGAAMRRAIDRRAAADAQSTKELRDALSETADSRVDCVFGPDVMRQLAEARDRAAQAAAGGLLGALPAARGASGPAR